MAPYLGFGIGVPLCFLSLIGFGKFFFTNMVFTDPSQPDEVNARGSALQQRWARRFGSAWPLTWRICLSVICVCLLLAVVLAIT
jgi:hypothetical protein